MKLILFLSCLILASCSAKSWQTASRESVGIAPKASELKEDFVQIYYARASSWKGSFGVHPWIAWKEKDDTQYTITQVTSWNLRSEDTTINVKKDLPDRKWYGSSPTLLFEAKGKRATQIIEQAKRLIKTYPFTSGYTVWPGPNSNTFISYLIRNIDQLDIELPPTAIGKDYFGKTTFISNTASNTGFIFSMFGLFGFTIGLAEGVEVNLLGLYIGIDLWTPALKLPLIGRLGFKDI